MRTERKQEYTKKDEEERRVEEWTAYGDGDTEITDISVVSDGSCGNEV